MSVRLKRTLSRGDEPGVSKRRKAEPEEWHPRLNNDLKIYNSRAPEAPAELFRKDLISAMKLPDSEPLVNNEFWVITDPWKQEWERGVQVPVNPDSLPEPAVSEIDDYAPYPKNDFKLPKQKYVRLAQDRNFDANEHSLSNAASRAETMCAYDMDACDAAWLKALNGERAKAGVPPLHEEQLERVIEVLEIRCWEKIQSLVKSEEGLGIEYDENVICDVCRSPDSEEGNEMVFCDSCNICVHQACYGITTIPSGQWLCSPCADEVRPVCVLCPNLGGAMKCTPSRHQWAHVSCVLWIPEVSIGCAERMEPITKISAIPPSRWSLVCTLCRERAGACIQCSVKSCKIAYHVTCAFKHGLEMRAIIEDENADDGVKLRSYCVKHSVPSKKDKNAGSGSDEDESKRKRRKDMTLEEKNQARAQRQHEIESEFDRHVSIKDISTQLSDVDPDGIQYMYNYWKLKRKSRFNRPLLNPKIEESDMHMHRQEQADLDKKRMFVQLRQDLERVRNLCYMVSRREKLSRSFIRLREQTFHKQLSILSGGYPLSPPIFDAVMEANHGPSIYDRLYSHIDAADHTDDFESILALIGGVGTEDNSRKDLNGLIRRNKSNENTRGGEYCNGSVRRMSTCGWLSSDAESMPEKLVPRQQQSKYRKPIYSTTDEDENEPVAPPKKKSLKDKANDNNGKISSRKGSRQKSKKESSSEESIKTTKDDKHSSRSTLRQLESEMGARSYSESESDELVPIRTTKKYKLSKNIYSDSEGSDNFKNEDINEDKSSNATSDSQQHPVRTKAAVKEFIPLPKGVAKGGSSAKKSKVIESDDERRDKDSFKTKEYPSDLIVPQRKAAKKASENMRSTTVVKNKEPNDGTAETKTVPLIDDMKVRSKQKFKEKRKESKDVSPVSKKDTKSHSLSSDTFELEKDLEKDGQDVLAYVPQRQAAKKAAEHIKSGLSKVPEAPVEDFGKKKESTMESQKKSPRKDEEKKPLKISKSSSSSSSSSSSVSDSSSSSEDENDEKQPSQRHSEKRNVTSSSFSPPRRLTDDLPFLDKGPKVTSSSSDSETTKETLSKVNSKRSSPRRIRTKKSVTLSPSTSLKTTTVSPRKASDKKLKASDELLESGPHASSSEREKSFRTGDSVSRSSTHTRTRSITSGSGSVSDRKDSGARKSDKEDPMSSHGYKDSKENRESSKLSSAQWKTDKKLKIKPSDDSSTYQKKNETWSSGAEIKKDQNKSSKNQKYSSKSEKTSNEGSHKEKNRPDYFGDISDAVSDSKTTRKRKSNEYKKNETSEKRSETRSIFSPERTPETRETRESTAVSKLKSPMVESEHQTSDIVESKTKRDSKSKSKQKLPIDISSNVTCESIKSSESHDPNKSGKSSFASAGYNRSLFSPPASKDAGGSDVFDFCNDMLAVDETMSDDGFNISQGSEIMKNASLTFFSSDFLFKEDSKEDRGVPETLHLVEKLRMKLDSKKTGSGNQDDASEPDNIENKEHDKSISLIVDSDTLYKKSESSDDSKEVISVVERNEIENVDNHTVTSTLPRDTQHQELFDDAARSSLSKERSVELSPVKPSPRHLSAEHEKSNQSNVDESIGNVEILRNDTNTQESLSKKNYLPSEEKQFETASITQHSELQSGSYIHNEPVEQGKISVKAFGDFVKKFSRDPMQKETPVQSECSSIPSPYNSMQQQAKWSESELMPTRRSSTSSTSSETSSISHKHKEIDHSKVPENIQVQQQHPLMQNMGYSNLPMPPCPPYMSSMETSYNQFSSEASQFVGGPVPLFPPPSEMQENPSPMYTSYHHALNALKASSMPYPPLCSPAFTSSHNIALTTAMINTLASKPIESNIEGDHRGDQYNLHHPSLPSIDDYLSMTLVPPQPQQPEVPIEKPTVANIVEPKKSPAKPARSSARFTPQQVKSPCKSPSKSPKQPEKSRRGGHAKGSRGGRGRGRPRGRTTQNVHSYSHLDMNLYGIDNTIHKLQGTVYDFDCNDEISNEIGAIDIKSMRRRSTDVHEKKCENYKDSSQSPKFASPQQHSNKRSFIPDIKELKPPTPITNTVEAPPPAAVLSNPVEGVRPFTNIVQPVLPGPVDRYSAFEPSNTDTFNSHLLGEFDSETADQQLADIDEEVEIALHSALQASSNKIQETPQRISPLVSNEPTIQEPIHEICTPKVSLTDPRNQLKVKIKGPFLDANYSSYIPPTIQQPPLPPIEQPIQVLGTPSAVGSVNSGMTCGTSNLRRMRKKELLRQYWTQDMNMDDPGSGNIINEVIPPVPVASYNRNIITIPKAVASMTSIPTKEDYKAVVDANMEKKKRKVSGGMRHFDHGDDMQDNQGPSSSLTAVGQTALSYKRRGRAPKQPATPAASAMITPKLKIKIGSYLTSESTSLNADPKCDFQFKPPKKRLASIPKPSVEDMRRESMKFRRQIIADFKEGKKEKKKRDKSDKSEKSEKRKKKKDKRSSEIHVVDKKLENSTKLIIRIRKKDEETTNLTEEKPSEPPAPPAPTADNPFDYDPSAPDPLALDSPSPADASKRSSKVSPIRLKLSRGAGGSGYVMKDSPGAPTESVGDAPELATSAPIEAPATDPISCPMPHNKHCEVR